ncbi:MAG: hypothetical protein AAGD13_20880 [Pseudomonadota bacterium]
MTESLAAANAIVERVKRDPHSGVNAEDAAILMRVPDRTLMMEKLLAIHFNQIQDFPRALEQARAVFAHEPTAEGAKNVALLLRRCGRLDDAVAFSMENESLFEPVEWNDTLCMTHWQRKDKEASIRHGRRSLELKDAAAPDAPEITPVRRSFDAEAPKRNIIAYSLFGSDQRYLMGAMNNAIVARYLYPGWTARFYVDDSVPAAFCKQLGSQGAQVLKIAGDWPASKFGLFWRFLVEDDAEVDFFLVRDADSVCNIKERAAVEDWLRSGKAFHVMRDLPIHSELILAGMWGAQRGNIGQMAKRVKTHVKTAEKKLNNRITDQEFTRNVLWPIVCQDVLAHDPHLRFAGAVPFRDEFRLPPSHHIGQNDWVHFKPTQKSK